MDEDTIRCETEHEPSREARYTIHIAGSDSAANCSFVCGPCADECVELAAPGETILVLPYPYRRRRTSMAQTPNSNVVLLLVQYDGQQPITQDTADSLRVAMEAGEGVTGVHATAVAGERATEIRMLNP